MQTPCNYFEKQVNILVEMAQLPGFRDHSILRGLELESDPSGVFAGVRAAVAARLNELAAPTPTKPD